MADVARKTNLTKEDRKKLADKIASFFLHERGENIDVIASNQLLDFFTEILEPAIYNRAIEDARDTIKLSADEVDFKVSILKK